MDENDAGTAVPRRRCREATAAALIDAAKAVFAERGFDAATTREIAAGAGVNEQLIQRYFGGKSGLLLAVVDRFGREEGGGCALPPPGDDLEAEILSFLELQAEHSWKYRDLSKVVLDRALVDPGMAERMGRTLAESRIPCMLGRLEALRERGLIDPHADLASVAAGLASLSFALGFMERVVFAGDPERLCAVTRSLARTMAQGLAPRS
ncbi:TetR/AcrR family transcriptional regulator [Azospirillum sp. ST 5-10]|uniref:TetR/AcrR family transcriptional regulator n=1 Tax=unclassified Azospirillum TaxID=2630922 RepID=UPI003F49E490